LAEGGVIEKDDLPEPPRPEAARAPEPQAAPGDQEELAALLKSCGGNVSQAARRLGVDRSTIHRRMRRLGRRAADELLHRPPHLQRRPRRLRRISRPSPQKPRVFAHFALGTPLAMHWP
ncbi:MAG TPA: helix-turn-helix domain-containing protein, partial [Paracoccaceae bacterium]|nr:helix-turn-helix domain-containing protein [Paracoccaceae bacterium]